MNSQGVAVCKGSKGTTVTDGAEAITKEPVSIVFVGHVDAGKTSIADMVLYLTGRISERELEKVRGMRKKGRKK